MKSPMNWKRGYDPEYIAEIMRLTKPGMQLLLLLVCLAPPLLFIYMGTFSRLITDDFCIVITALESDPWRNMLEHYKSWSGSYFSAFLKSVLAALDVSAPSITPALLILFWTAGLYLLAGRMLACFTNAKRYRVLSLAAAAGAVAAAVNAFFTPQSILWFSASLPYTLPLVMLTWYFALALWTVQHANGGALSIPLIAGGTVICFLSAGSAEMTAAFQSLFFTLLMLAILLFLRGLLRRRVAIVIGAGWLATLLGLLIQAMSPGVAVRSAVYGRRVVEPVRDLSTLVSRTAYHASRLLADSEALVGFMLLLALGILAAFALRPCFPRVDARRAMQLKRKPLFAGLAIQVICIPLLWQHSSDNPVFLGRFSLSFMTVVALNLVFLSVSLALIWQRRRVNDLLAGKRAASAFVIVVMILMALLLFSMTQFRSIHWRASVFLALNCHALLGILAWQLLPFLPARFTQRFAAVVVSAYTLTLITMTAIVLVGVSRLGAPVLRTVTFAAYFLTSLGAIWGTYFGLVLKSAAASHQISDRLLTWLKSSAMATAILICAGMTLGHARLLPDLQVHADGWDARHQYILQQREAGEREITVAPLEFILPKYIKASRISRHGCPLDYYKVDKIIERKQPSS